MQCKCAVMEANLDVVPLKTTSCDAILSHQLQIDIPGAMQCRAGSPGRGASLTAKAVVGAPKQWSLAANASRDIALAGESERQRSLLQAARWEHSESSGTARRALKVGLARTVR
jgi:hypothetical protein